MAHPSVEKVLTECRRITRSVNKALNPSGLNLMGYRKLPKISAIMKRKEFKGATLNIDNGVAVITRGTFVARISLTAIE